MFERNSIEERKVRYGVAGEVGVKAVQACTAGSGRHGRRARAWRNR